MCPDYGRGSRPYIEFNTPFGNFFRGKYSLYFPRFAQLLPLVVSSVGATGLVPNINNECEVRDGASDSKVSSPAAFDPI